MQSNIKIISGKYKGRILELPKNVRPTQNRSRIAVFNILNNFSKPLNVWDVFAGSGAFGIECISRYNSFVVFSDIDKVSVNTIKNNLKNLPSSFYKIENNDAINIISKYFNSDLIFLDPPYMDINLINNFLKLISKLLKYTSLVILETDKTNIINIPDNLKILEDRIYGRSRFLFLTKS